MAVHPSSPAGSSAVRRQREQRRCCDWRWWPTSRALLTSADRLAVCVRLRCARVRAQIKSGSYDAEANRELLKLYAVAPDMIRLVSRERE